MKRTMHFESRVSKPEETISFKVHRCIIPLLPPLQNYNNLFEYWHSLPVVKRSLTVYVLRFEEKTHSTCLRVDEIMNGRTMFASSSPSPLSCPCPMCVASCRIHATALTSKCICCVHDSARRSKPVSRSAALCHAYVSPLVTYTRSCRRKLSRVCRYIPRNTCLRALSLSLRVPHVCSHTCVHVLTYIRVYTVSVTREPRVKAFLCKAFLSSRLTPLLRSRETTLLLNSARARARLRLKNLPRKFCFAKFWKFFTLFLLTKRKGKFAPLGGKIEEKNGVQA